MTHEEIEQKLTYLLDRQEIADVITTYCRAVDRLDREALNHAYHEDIVDDHGVFAGNREEFWDWVRPMHSEFHEVTQHVLSNQLVEIDGDTAHAETYVVFTGINRTGVPYSQIGGRYVDRLEKQEGCWKIVARMWIEEYELPAVNDREAVKRDQASTVGSIFGPRETAMMATRPTPKRDRTDPSYRRPLEVDENRLEKCRNFSE